MINCITSVKTIVFFIRDGFTPIQKHAACQSDFICIGYLRTVINSTITFVDYQSV
jgi:hypothetical protein